MEDKKMSIVKSFSVGQGDMYYIKHRSSNFTIIDCYLTEENKDLIVDEIIREKKGKDIVRFISTHPDDDHIGGLKYLDEKIDILNFYCVKNEYNKETSDDYNRYYELRNDGKKTFCLYKGCKRRWMNKDDAEKGYGASGINILWPITTDEDFLDALNKAKEGGSPNNISPIIKYSLSDGVNMLWFGDLEEEFTEKIQEKITLPHADIIFAPHHGRDKLPQEWLKQISPQIVVIGEAPAKHLNYYQNYHTITQNSAKDITFECQNNKIHIYVSSDSYSVDFLNDEKKENTYGHYIGSLDI